MIALRDIVDFCKAEALASRFLPSEVSDWRYFCREYSKLFHTPLHQVAALSPEHVILSVIEDQLESKNPYNDDHIEELTTELRRLEDPEYDAKAEKEIQQFVSNVEAGEKKRLARGDGIPLPSRYKKAKPAPVAKEPPAAPKSGFVDLSRFANENEES